MRATLLTICLIASPALADDWVIGTDAVVNVNVASNADPIPASFEPALRQSQALQSKNPKATQWLVNVDWLTGASGSSSS